MARVRQGLQRTGLLVLNPVAILGAVWALDLAHVGIAAFPFMGLFALITGGGLAYAAALRFRWHGQV